MPTIRLVQDEQPLLDLNPYTIAGLSPTFSRAGVAYERSEAGLLVQRAAGELRSDHWEMDPVAGVDRRHILLEGQATNRLWPSSMETHWEAVGLASRSASPVSDPTGGSAAWRLQGLATGTDGYIWRTATGFPASAAIAVSVWVRRVSTSGVLRVTNAASSTIGEWHVDLAALPDAWVRLTADHPAVTVVTPYTATSEGTVGILFSATSGAPLSIDYWHAQQEPGAFRTSEILAPTAATTRSADNLSVPWPHAPQALSFYARFIERGVLASNGQRLLSTYDGGSGPFFYIGSAGGSASRWIAIHQSSAGAASVAALEEAPRGSRVELLVHVHSDGSVELRQRINSGAVSTSGRSAPQALDPAWSGKLYIGSQADGVHHFGAYRHVLVFRGIKDWDFFQRRAV